MQSSGNGDTLLYAKLQFLEPLWNLVNDLSLDGLPAASRHELHFDGVLPEVQLGYWFGTRRFKEKLAQCYRIIAIC
jgi:hypothetical protein